MNKQPQGFQLGSRITRLVCGVLGAAIGLGVVVSVIDGMSAQSGGQSLGQFVANQRAIAQSPVAQTTHDAGAGAGAVSASDL
jgi:hypothetical protein